MTKDESLNTYEYLRKRDAEHGGHDPETWRRLWDHIRERNRSHEQLEEIVMDLQTFVEDHDPLNESAEER